MQSNNRQKLQSATPAFGVITAKVGTNISKPRTSLSIYASTMDRKELRSRRKYQPYRADIAKKFFVTIFRVICVHCLACFKETTTKPDGFIPKPQQLSLHCDGG
jgi:hypothetical protein